MLDDQSDSATVSSCGSILSTAKAAGLATGKGKFGKFPVTRRALASKIKNLKIMKRIAPPMQGYILEQENSWIERMQAGQTMKIDDINSHLDLFFVVRGELEFTMREDPIHRARNNYSYNDLGSIKTESI